LSVPDIPYVIRHASLALPPETSRGPPATSPLASGAATVELDAMVRDGEPARRSRPAHQGPRVGFCEWPIHVGDPAADQAGEVVVLAQVAIEARVGSQQFLDQALGDEKPQVPVHGAQAHPRQPAPYQPMYGLGGRVRVAPADHLQDQSARTGKTEADTAQGGRRPVSPRCARIFIRNDSHYGAGD